MGFEGRCRVTGIGSLAVGSVEEALDFVFEFAPELPYLPQLPRLSPNEGMNEQMYEGLPGLDRRDGKWLIVQSEAFFEAVAQLFERFENPDDDAGTVSPRCSAALAAFLKRVKASGVAEAKAQVSGPVTVGMSILDEDGTPVLYNDVLRDVLVKHLSLKVRWLARQIEAAGARPVIFVDEPFLTSFGTPFFGWTRPEQPREVIEQVYQFAPVKGTHCCANTDWTVFLRSSVDIVSFDAFGYATGFLTYREELTEFIRRGGNIAWGIVPTDPEALAGTSAEELAGRLRELIAKLASYGLDRKAILRQSLITPSCGLGSRPPSAARPAFEMARAVSAALRTKDMEA
jgi:methionine synthase II (cobalamin-independent)